MIEKESLIDKRVLFLSPKFFSYEIMLKNKLESMGAEVLFFDERPSNTTLGKSLLRINRKLMEPLVKKYYEKIIKEISGQQFDYILICQAEATPLFFLDFLDKHYQDSHKVLYLWDSVKNKINTVEKAPFFDQVYSFDIQDCEKYDWKFRPLFFDSSYEEIKRNKGTKLDLFFVGTVHSDRYLILEKIKKIFSQRNKVVYFYYYIPSKLMFFYYKYIKRIIPGAKLSDFNYHSLDRTTLQAKLENAQVVIDIQHPLQTGLTMRTIEMLGASKKIITTNQDIIHYDFYNPLNVCVIDRNDVVIPDSFLSSPYQQVDESIYCRYSIKYFLEELLGIEQKEGSYYR
ncbi:lipopolysaccharide biosynthesis protein [Lapidilactobacillus wuchangensis]|uniref:lipopolysaccharide biosynthesis protein n=1 Tax=Lapidilactobacillus wuchangensis TaxID=2486001 RepID=UPI001CDD7A42|nr:lipopolysaccharide biosynthesis protein [Lapidilactobacillus wuchangensis]